MSGFKQQRREKYAKKMEEEKDSCPTITQSSQQSSVMSQRNDITSNSCSPAPSVHPSIFQTAHILSSA